MAVKECGRAAVSPLRGSARDQCGECGARLRQLASPRLASVLLVARFPDQSHLLRATRQKGRSARRAERSVRVCIQNSAGPDSGCGSPTAVTDSLQTLPR